MSRRFDIIISGGGPAGLACAIRFARRNLRVLVVERRKLPQEKCCGEFLHPTAVRELERLGINLDGAPAIERFWLAAGNRQTEFKINGESRAMPRLELSKRLLHAALAAGAEIETGGSVEEVIPGPEGVRVRMGRGVVETRLLIVAEGSASETARRLGLAHRRGSHIYGFSMRCPVDLRGHVSLGALRDGYAGLCDIGNGWANLAGLLRPSAYLRLSPHRPGFLDRLRTELPAWSDWLASPSESAFYQAPVCVVSSARRDLSNVWLAGDSAGMRETAFGDGIARSLRQAALADEAFEESGGNLDMAAGIYEDRRRTDAHRANRISLKLSGAVLRHPSLTAGLAGLAPSVVQQFCLSATAVQ